MAHHNRLQELRGILDESLLIISYETFARQTAMTIDKLQQFLSLQNPIKMPDVKTDSLGKWRGQLSEQDVSEIQQIVGIPPEL